MIKLMEKDPVLTPEEALEEAEGKALGTKVTVSFDDPLKDCRGWRLYCRRRSRRRL